MRFVVYGAGAIGGVLGARLHEHGHEVVLVARGAHFDAVRAHGLKVVDATGETSHGVTVVDRIAAAEPGPDDVVLLTMKSQDTENALRELAACTTAPAVACVQNGIESERLALRRFDRVYGVLNITPGVHLEPGVVTAHAFPETGILDVGRYPGGSDGQAEAIAAALRSATYLSEARDDVMAWKTSKLLVNLMNAAEALAGRDETAGFAGAVRDEGERVLRAAGIPFVPVEELMRRRSALTFGDTGRGSSTWQSLSRGLGEVETDYLNGEIVLHARRHGLAAPLNERLQRLARDVAARGGKPGSLPVSALFG